MGFSGGSIITTTFKQYTLLELFNVIQKGGIEYIVSPEKSYQITSVIYEGQKEMSRISTISGRTIVCSSDTLFANSYSDVYDTTGADSLMIINPILVAGHALSVHREEIVSIEDVGTLDSYALQVEANHPVIISLFVTAPIYQEYTPTPPQHHNQGAYFGLFG